MAEENKDKPTGLSGLLHFFQSKDAEKDKPSVVSADKGRRSSMESIDRGTAKSKAGFWESLFSGKQDSSAAKGPPAPKKDLQDLIRRDSSKAGVSDGPGDASRDAASRRFGASGKLRGAGGGAAASAAPSASGTGRRSSTGSKKSRKSSSSSSKKAKQASAGGEAAATTSSKGSRKSRSSRKSSRSNRSKKSDKAAAAAAEEEQVVPSPPVATEGDGAGLGDDGPGPKGPSRSESLGRGDRKPNGGTSEPPADPADGEAAAPTADEPEESHGDGGGVPEDDGDDAGAGTRTKGASSGAGAYGEPKKPAGPSEPSADAAIPDEPDAGDEGDGGGVPEDDPDDMGAGTRTKGASSGGGAFGEPKKPASPSEPSHG